MAAALGAQARDAATPAVPRPRPASPFEDAAGVRVLTRAPGRVSVAMSVPEWLTGPRPGPRVSPAAMLALAEVALVAAVESELRAEEQAVTASLQLRGRGPVTDAQPSDAGHERPRPVSFFSPPPAFPPPVARGPQPYAPNEPVELRAEAVADQDDDEPPAALRRASVTITGASGRAIAEATAVCVVVPRQERPPLAAGGPPEPPAQRPRTNQGPAPAQPATAALPASPAPLPPNVLPLGLSSLAGVVDHAPPPHPLLAALDATVSERAAGGDTQTLVRLRPPAWLANRRGGVHEAAAAALADAAMGVALARVLRTTGSAAHVLTLDLTVLRSLPRAAELATVATVRQVGRRLAVVEAEVGCADARPGMLVRATMARRNQQRRPL